jgi:copper chaperone CopZ
MKKIIKIDGMHCNSCATLIQEELENKVKSIVISVLNKKATVEFDEKKISINQIKETITKMGYKVEVIN